MMPSPNYFNPDQYAQPQANNSNPQSVANSDGQIRDTANPPSFESEEDKKKRMAAEAAAAKQGTVTQQPGPGRGAAFTQTQTNDPRMGQGGPQQFPQEFGNTPGAPAQSPMISPNGGIPPGIPYNPVPPAPTPPAPQPSATPPGTGGIKAPVGGYAAPVPQPIAQPDLRGGAGAPPPPGTAYRGEYSAGTAEPGSAPATTPEVPDPRTTQQPYTPGAAPPGAPTGTVGATGTPPAGGPKPSPQDFIKQWQASHSASEGIGPLADAMKAAGYGNVSRFMYGSTPSNNEMMIDGVKYKVMGAENGPNPFWYAAGTDEGNGGGGGGMPPLPQTTPTPQVSPGFLAPPTPSTPIKPATPYIPGTISPFNPIDQSQQMSGLNDLISKITGAQGADYQSTNFDQYNAPDQSQQQGQLTDLISKLMGANAPTLANSNFSQFNPSGSNQQVNDLQNKNMTDILSNPVYNQDYLNNLNEQQKELLVNRGQAEQRNLSQDAARRGVTNGGNTEATSQRMQDELTKNLLQSQRDISMGVTGANRQGMLDALSGSQNLLSSRMGAETQGYNAKLAGENAAAGENSRQYQTGLDAAALKNQAAQTAQSNLANQAGIASGQYNTKLAGQNAQAQENSRKFDAANAIRTANNQAAQTAAGVLSTQAGIANQNASTKLANQVAQNNANLQGAQFNEGTRQFDTNTGLAHDQFNESTRQFNMNFIEQVRQFDKQLAQQMEQFNKQNQQGYDLANLNSQNQMINTIMNG